MPNVGEPGLERIHHFHTINRNMAVENRLGGKVVLLLGSRLLMSQCEIARSLIRGRSSSGNEASIDRFSENLAAEG